MSATRSEASGPGGKIVCPWLHTEVCCDGCRASPISGIRYKCQIREGFDLCSSCFRRQSPAAQQHFIRIERCQASKPYQIYYIECRDCGTAPIKGPRYQHKTQAKTDLCELCFKKATSFRQSLEFDFEKIEETKIRSKGKKHYPALHFDKACDECQASPIMGPCYTSIKNPNYDLCAHCHNHTLMQGKFKDGDFVVASVTFHLNVICCVYCGAFPIYGQSYKNQRKENKKVCLLCFFHIKKEKKCYFTMVEPPRSVSTVLQASPPNVVPKSSLTLNLSAAHISPHSKSAFLSSSTLPQQYGQRSASFTQPSSAIGPPLAYAPASAAPYQQPYSYSASLHPSRNSYPGSYPGPVYPPASHYQQNSHQAAASGAVPNSRANSNRIDVGSFNPLQQMNILYKYYNMQTAQRKQEIQAFMRRNQHASHEAQNQYLQQFLQKLANGGGGGGGGGVGGGGGGGGVDYSFLFGGNNGGGVDYSSLVGGNNSGGVDYSSLMGGNNGSGVDYSSLMGGNIAGGNVDFSSLTGGGGLDPSMFMQGGGAGGVLNSLLSAFGGLSF